MSDFLLTHGLLTRLGYPLDVHSWWFDRSTWIIATVPVPDSVPFIWFEFKPDGRLTEMTGGNDG